MEWTVKYTLCNGLERDVEEKRMTQANKDQQLAPCSAKKTALKVMGSPLSPAPISTVFDNISTDGNSMLVGILKRGGKKDKGFRRRELWKIHHKSQEMPKHLRPEERILMSLESVFLNGQKDATQKDLNHAWGTSNSYAVDNVRKIVTSGGRVDRVERSDKNQSIISSPDFLLSRVTDYSVCKRLMLGGDYETGTGRKFDDAELRSMFDELSDEDLEEVHKFAIQEKNNVLNAKQDLFKLFRESNGTISWDELRRRIGANLGVKTIMRFIKSLGGFKYVSPGILPWTAPAQMQKAFEWSKEFWIFWGSVAILSIPILLVHMDEKVSTIGRTFLLIV